MEIISSSDVRDRDLLICTSSFFISMRILYVSSVRVLNLDVLYSVLIHFILPFDPIKDSVLK